MGQTYLYLLYNITSVFVKNTGVVFKSAYFQQTMAFVASKSIC